MDLQYVRKLVKIADEAQIAEIEIEEDGRRIRITRMTQSVAVQQMALPGPAPVMAAPVAAPAAVAAIPAPAGETYHEVRSPIVGTFYRAVAPDADPFVQVGRRVQKGETVCIIEAMKIMNEIESDISGTVVRIMVENGQPVEYNQVLFLVDPS
jgi:acetyl-CoA carboxylase biotin carboxyl carrier protein